VRRYCEEGSVHSQESYNLVGKDAHEECGGKSPCRDRLKQSAIPKMPHPRPSQVQQLVASRASRWKTLVQG
jgi:hypothetical protein